MRREDACNFLNVRLRTKKKIDWGVGVGNTECSFQIEKLVIGLAEHSPQTSSPSGSLFEPRPYPRSGLCIRCLFTVWVRERSPFVTHHQCHGAAAAKEKNPGRCRGSKRSTRFLSELLTIPGRCWSGTAEARS